MLRALAAELSDPGRFSRAKAYARDGAVIDIDIGPGEVRATIQGSRYEPYVASVYVAPSDDHDSLLGLIPDRDELQATCSCPDDGPYGGAFCKHALDRAAGAGRRGHDRARGAGPVAHRRPGGRGVGDPAATAGRADRRTRRPASTSRWSTSWSTALAAPAPIPGPPDLPARLPVTMAARGGPHGEDVARVLADALAVLRSR